MALVERLMGLNDDGAAPVEGQAAGLRGSKIHVHEFFAIVQELISGGQTVPQLKAAVNARATADASGKSDEQEIDSIVLLAPGALLPGERALFINRLHAIFLLAERRYPGYATAAQVRAKIGI